MTDNVLYRGDKTSVERKWFRLTRHLPIRENLKYVGLLPEVRVAPLFSRNTESL